MHPLYTKPLAITDVETSGNHFGTHEILEIGLVLINQNTLEILDQWSIKVKPEHIETAFIQPPHKKRGRVDGQAVLDYCGYNEEDWRNSVPLKEAIKTYMIKAKGAIFCAYNDGFDYGFIEEACRKTGVLMDLDYHSIDILTLIIEKLRGQGVDRLNVNAAAQFFGLPPEPMPHRALNGALLEYEIYKRLRVM